MKNKLGGFLRSTYTQLVKIDDSPHKIALGASLGVFTGIFPGTGPLAALFLALILKANRAAALVGSLLTNSWATIALFAPAAAIARFFFKAGWREGVTKPGFYLSLSTGYFISALTLGIISYLIIFLILQLNVKLKKKE